MKILKLMVISLAMVTWLGGCMDVNDDIDQLKKDVSALDERLTTTEDAVKSLQADIAAGKLITAVNPYVDPTTQATGWEILFSDNSKKHILNGLDGITPYTWINDNGHWAVNSDSNGKPVDSNNTKYEIKDSNSQPIIASTSMKVVKVTKNGVDYIGFQQYNTVTNANIGNVVETIFPYDGGKIIAAIEETDDTYTFTIDGQNYILPRASIYPESVTVLRYATSIIKGESITFGVRVNPNEVKTVTKEEVTLIYVESYKSKASYGVVPDFVTVKDFTPTDVKGEYDVTLSWAKGVTFPKDAAIYVVVHYTDNRNMACEVVSSTPIILNEQYVTILDAHVGQLPDVYIFSDETYVDSVRFIGYHEDYVNSISYVLAETTTTGCTDLTITSPGLPSDKSKFSIQGCANHLYSVHRVTTSITDKGRPKVEAIAPDPYTNTPGTPEMPAIAAKTVTKTFNVYNYNVLDYVVDHKIADRWLPNVAYSMEKNALDTMIREGYRTEDGWNFEVTGFTYKHNSDPETTLPASITTDISKFNLANAYTIGLNVANTVDYGTHEVFAKVKATTTSRHKSLSSERDFVIRFIFTLVPPMFEVNLKSAAVDGVFGNSNKFTTYKNENVVLADVINVKSNRNVSSTHPNIAKLGESPAYTYATPQDANHEQGLYFNIYPQVNKPATPEAWAQTTNLTAFVKLATGQEIPVKILKSTNTAVTNGAKGLFDVIHAKPEFTSVKVIDKKFFTSYNQLQSVTLDVSKKKNSTDSNFSAIASYGTVTNQVLPENCIASTTYTVVGVVTAEDNSPLPAGLPTTLLQVDATGKVSALDTSTWDDSRTLYQNIEVKITDIWGNFKTVTVSVFFKSSTTAPDIS